jgi:hypothetical protein
MPYNTSFGSLKLVYSSKSVSKSEYLTIWLDTILIVLVPAGRPKLRGRLF